MRIALVAQPMDYLVPPVEGGSSIAAWIYNVAQRLSKQAEVRVYASHGPAWTHHCLSHEGVTYQYFPEFPQSVLLKAQRLPYKVHRLARQKFPSIRWQPFTLPSYATEHVGYGLFVARALKKYPADVVHVINFTQLIPIIRRLNPHTSIVLNMHCEWLSQLDRTIMGKRLRQADAMIGCSTHITQEVQDAFPWAASRCFTVWNAVDPEIFHPSDTPASGKEQKLLFIGRISPEKGVHTLIKAFIEHIAPRFPDLKLYLIGSEHMVPAVDTIVEIADDPHVRALKRFYDNTPYFIHLQRMIPASLKERIIFTGGLSHKEIPDLLRQATLLVNPSLSESFGISLIEAMACEVPVVATRVGGMTDIVQNERNGLLVPPESPNDLASAIIRLLEQPELRQKLGKQGRTDVLNRFTWKHTVDRLLSVYQHIQQAHAPSQVPLASIKQCT